MANLSIPAIQTAIIQHEGGILKITDTAAVPKLLPGWLLVRNHAVALNPCDFKMAARFPTSGLKDGVDFAGVVVAVGHQEISGFQSGDCVLGCVPSNKQDDAESGAFSDYVKIEEIYTIKMPPGMSFEMAMGLNPACISTVALALHKSFKMPATPYEAQETGYYENAPVTVFVYGGSSCIGLIAIQLLKLLGHTIVTTCSPHNFDLVRDYGADVAFDYHSPTCAADIRAYTKDRLRYVIDPFGEAATISLCYEAIGRAGGIYCALEQYNESLCTRRVVKHQLIMGPSILGRGVLLPEPYGIEPDEKLHEWSKLFYRHLQQLIDEDKLKPLPIEVLQPPGFKSIISGLGRLQSRRVSGKKLVVKLLA